MEVPRPYARATLVAPASTRQGDDCAVSPTVQVAVPRSPPTRPFVAASGGAAGCRSDPVSQARASPPAKPPRARIVSRSAAATAAPSTPTNRASARTRDPSRECRLAFESAATRRAAETRRARRSTLPPIAPPCTASSSSSPIVHAVGPPTSIGRRSDAIASLENRSSAASGERGGKHRVWTSNHARRVACQNGML